jgi:hypothetical protein
MVVVPRLLWQYQGARLLIPLRFFQHVQSEAVPEVEQSPLVEIGS